MTRRKVQDDVETGGISLTRDEPGGWPDCCPGGIRCEGGVTLNQASILETIDQLIAFAPRLLRAGYLIVLPDDQLIGNCHAEKAVMVI